MKRSPRREEQFAFAVIGKELGVTVHPHHDGSRDGMVDGRFRYGDGRHGVVEVTTYVDPEAFRTESIIAKISPRSGSSRRSNGRGS